ncbi:MAG: hypothetical protein JRF30_13045, partial [Deltaproteobacteria bacterium]|nr:hypothetical protein [Deltaproteobacteria bacterium]
MTDLRRFGMFVCISVLLLVCTIFLGCARLKTSNDFEDVLVPSELKVDKKRSFIFYHAPDFTAGVLVLRGRVEVKSLIRFFENNMAKDNWRLASSLKSPCTIMFFNKPNRGCIINITERQLKTEVEIWVAPTMGSVEEGL